MKVICLSQLETLHNNAWVPPPCKNDIHKCYHESEKNSHSQRENGENDNPSERELSEMGCLLFANNECMMVEYCLLLIFYNTWHAPGKSNKTSTLCFFCYRDFSSLYHIHICLRHNMVRVLLPAFHQRVETVETREKV